MGGTIVLTLIEALLILLALLISKAIRFISPSLCGDQLVVDDSTKDDVILTQTSPPPSSPIVFSPPTTKYDVFLSFRGEDTRHTFATYLYKGLSDAGIHTFMDYKLRKGKHISQVLLRTIEESEISMIIFSKNYASSTWCMDELVHIMECKEKFGRDVIPIFYNVDPSNIRKQNGSFGKGFDELKLRFVDNPEKLQRWSDALIQSVSLSGWDSKSTSCAGPEFKLIDEIVKDILSKLNYKPSYHREGLIGIHRHIRNIENLLTEARIVGIWGMGGAGKTTLAKVIFQELRGQFDAFSFIDVNKQLERISLDELKQICLQELLKDNDIRIWDIESTFVKKRLGRKKFLLILDDVVKSRIANDLIKWIGWFGKESRIIITSRDIQVLRNASASSTYHVLDLDFQNSLRLFSLKAFHQHEPFKGYMDLSISVVKYCQGNPLALDVLGCSLYGRVQKEWEMVLEKLDKDPPDDVVDVLKLSFDGLDEQQQNVFLDLAFLINERVDISLNLIRQLYDSYAPIEITFLREKSLISVAHHCSIVREEFLISYDHHCPIVTKKSLISFDHHCYIYNCYIMMHDLVKKMGLKVAEQQLSFANPRTLVRLWKYEDIHYYFSCGKAIEAIRCMSLDVSKIKKITLEASILQKMRNLIFLKIYKSHWRKPSMLNIPEVLNYLSEELRFLCWEEYPLPYVPLHFCAENLVTLEMCNSNIRQLWNGNQHFPNLEKIDLADSKHLSELPDLSQVPKIKFLILHGCVNLAQIHSSTFQPVGLGVYYCGPMQIKVGGNIKGRSSGLVIVSGYLDLRKLSFNKVTLKVFICGNRICGVRLKLEIIPLKEIEDLRIWTQSLLSLLPFVRKVEWFELPIEFGHDFNRHFDYYFHYENEESRYYEEESSDYEKESSVDSVDEKDESSDDEQRGDRREMMNGHQVVTMSLMEDDDEEDVSMEHCYSKSVTFIRVPNSITRWSLLKELTLKSLPISNEYCRRIKPLLDVTISSPDIILPLYTYSYIQIGYGFDRGYFQCCLYGGSHYHFPYGSLGVKVGPESGPTRHFEVWPEDFNK